MHDTEDKKYWVEFGRTKEDLFVANIAPQLNLDAIINPEKVNNPFSADLLVNGKIADLKTQETPIFTAYKYGKNSQTTITFNEKDLLRYSRLYPDIVIYFHVNWKVLSDPRFSAKVVPMNGVWEISLDGIKELIANGKAGVIRYQYREDDRRGNARVSYVLSLSGMKFLGYVK